MKKTKALLIILGIYLLALGVGAATALLLNDYIDNVILVVLIADIASTLVVFISSIPLKNASVYDPYWSVAPPFLAAGFYLLSCAAFSWTHLFVLIPLGIWAVRLTYNWAVGFTDLKWEDWRYVKYKQSHPKVYILINLTGIMIMPTLLVFAGMIPFYYFIAGPSNQIIAAISGAIIFFATIYQTIADRQKRKFLKDSANKGKVIDTGLWKLSRHPNYFGEVTNWWGIFVCGLWNFHWLAAFGAPLITMLFMFISIPMMSKHLLKTRPAYAEYKTRVRSALIPFPSNKLKKKQDKK